MFAHKLLCITAAPPLLLADELIFPLLLPRSSSVLQVLDRFALVVCCFVLTSASSISRSAALCPVLPDLEARARPVHMPLPVLGRHRLPAMECCSLLLLFSRLAPLLDFAPSLGSSSIVSTDSGVPS